MFLVLVGERMEKRLMGHCFAALDVSFITRRVRSAVCGSCVTVHKLTYTNDPPHI
jgi:hypothetical protein